MDNTAHYVCESCEGVSDVPKACSTEGCDKNGESLKECKCDNSEHLEKAAQSKKQREETDND